MGEWRRAGRALGVAALMGVFFILTAAPGGGGFGGGGFGGGLGGGRGGGGSSEGFYYLFSALVLCLLPIIAVFSFLEYRRQARSPRNRMYLIHVVVSLRDAAHYLPVLDHRLSTARFRTPAERAELLQIIAGLLRGRDVEDAWISVDTDGREPVTSGRAVLHRWQLQMRRAGLNPKKPVRRADPTSPKDWCVLGLVFDTWDASPFRPGTRNQAIHALTYLRSSVARSDAFFFYYAPDPGQRLDRDTAAALLHRLKAVQEGDQPSSVQR